MSIPENAGAILEHFSGSDIHDAFLKIITDSGLAFEGESLRMMEAAFMMGSKRTFDLLDKANSIARHIAAGPGERDELYTVAYKQLYTELIEWELDQVKTVLLNALRRKEQ